MQFLVATDGSAESETALDHAISIADKAGASITVVHAVDPGVYKASDRPISSRSDAERSLIIESIADAEERGERLIEEAATMANDRGFDVETDVLYGDPVEVIAAYAEDGGYDGVFVGHRGRSEQVEGVVGSVAKKLVERSTVPVTVTK